MAAAIAAAALAFGGTNSASAAATSFSTGFQIQNLSNATANVTISFISSGTGAKAADVSATIPANGAVPFAVLPSTVAAGFTGGAVINSDQQVAAVVNVLANNNFNYGGAYSGFSAGANSVTVPLLFKGSFGFNSFFNVQNTGTADTNVTVTYSGGGLSAPVTESKAVKPGSSERFDQTANASLPAGFNGSAIVTSSGQPIAAAVVENGPTTLLAYNGFVGTSTAPVMPLINANNAGYITGVAMQNAGDQATNVTVSYTPSSPADGTACTETKAVPAKGTVFFGLDAFAATPPAGANDTCANGAKFVGSAKVTTNSASQPLIAVVNQLNSGASKGEAYESFDASAATGSIVLPLIQDRFFNYFTGFNIANVGTVATDVECTYSGTSVKQTVNVPAGGVATLIQQGAIQAGYNGAGVCAAKATGAKIVGVLNQVNPSAATDAFFVSQAINK
jgi:hypothetical protein